MSVLVPVRNEAADIREAVTTMLAQQFPGRVEFLLIDGRSEDETREILEELAREDDRIRVLDNPHCRIPHGLNIGFRQARGRYVARMDAHALYPADYLLLGVRRLERGGVEYVTGPALPHGVDAGSRRTSVALESPFGVGGAGFRRRITEETETDAGFGGLWRRETLETLGGWREDCLFDEDGEMAARLRKAGGRIVCVPDMAARYIPRRSVRALILQYWRYGHYRAKTFQAHPESMRRSHLLPPAVTLVVLGAFAPVRSAAALRVAAVLYATLLTAESVRVGMRLGTGRQAAALPVVFAAMHLSWGAGFLAGCARFGVRLAAIRSSLRSP